MPKIPDVPFAWIVARGPACDWNPDAGFFFWFDAAKYIGRKINSDEFKIYSAAEWEASR